MLSLAPGSTCDVCLETFGHNSKAPCSIQCGHVFCIDCLNNITRPACPLCRVFFSPQSVVKLHVDVDGAAVSSSPRPSSASDSEEARRLQEAITSITNQGTTEPHLRQVIQECRNFLSGQPRDTYTELRASYRMLAYLCEIKSTLRTQEQSVDELNKEIAKVAAEKQVLEQKISEMAIQKEKEQEKVEQLSKALQDRVTQAEAAYETMRDCYARVLSECFKLKEDAERHHSPGPPSPHSPSYRSSPGRAHIEITQKLATILNDAKAATPKPFSIPPLPQFSSGAHPPSSLTCFESLTEEDEEAECLDEVDMYAEEEGAEEIEEPMPKGPAGVKCRAIGHPYSCPCFHFSIFSDDSRPAGNSPIPVLPSTNRASVGSLSPLSVAIRSTLPIPQAQVNNSNSSASGRSRSHSIKSTRSSSPDATRSTNHSSSPRARSHKKVSDKKSDASPSPDRGPVTTWTPNNSDPESLRNRLHDILTTAPVSQSLPTYPADHYLSRERTHHHRHRSAHDDETSRSRSPSRSRSSPARKPSPRQPQQHVELAMNDHLSNDVSQPAAPSTTPNPAPTMKVSSASAAAQALANAQKAEKERQKELRRQQKERERGERDRTHSESKGVTSSAVGSLQTPNHVSSASAATATTMHPQGFYVPTGASLSRRGSNAQQFWPGTAAPAPAHREGSIPPPYPHIPQQATQPQQHRYASKGIPPSLTTSSMTGAPGSTSARLFS